MIIWSVEGEEGLINFKNRIMIRTLSLSRAYLSAAASRSAAIVSRLAVFPVYMNLQNKGDFQRRKLKL